MNIFGTSVHAALGRTRALDYSMVEEAVASHQQEDQQLDWKRAVGADANEVAKDVAAFANTRGGLLVYGVEEDPATSAAVTIINLDISDAAKRAFRSKLFSRLSPVVAGLAVEGLPAPDSADGATGLLVVQVPESPDSPHIIGTKRSSGVPYRVGTQTEWMNEWEIERAYLDRFARRTTDSERLDELIGHLEDQLDLDRGCWIVAASRPTVPISSSVSPPSRDASQQTVAEAVRLSLRILPTKTVSSAPCCEPTRGTRSTMPEPVCAAG